MKSTVTSLLALACVLSLGGPFYGAEPSNSEIEFFETKIRPVLVKHCYKCHSAKSKEPKGGLLLDTRQGIRRGGDSGHGVVPGELAESQVISAMRFESAEMPPDGQLSASIIADFEKWVKMGAPDPRKGASLVQKKIDFEKAKDYWAYRPIKKPAVPRTKDATWARSEIDRFILARLEEKGLRPTSDANRSALVRRLYLDLIGLPPTPEQVDEFEKDCSSSLKSDSKTPISAIERLVDKLLESPHFGERWGRHWLDVARYGESTGMERNYTFPQAWRYRDYVIASFNADKPYDQFIREQLAGDLLPADNVEQRREQLIATGFLAIGPKSLNERNREQFVMDIVDDQIDVTSRAFLGLTVACARCHDHKFDAIPQAEYYALAGIFRSTNTFYGTGGGNGNRQSGQLLQLDEMKVSAVRVGGGNPKGAKAKGRANLKQLKAQLTKLETQLSRVKKQSANAKAKKRVPKLEKQIKLVNKRLADARKGAATETPPAPPKPNALIVMGVQDTPNPSDTELRVRGEPGDRGATIPRSFLTVAKKECGEEIPAQKSGRRQLADWIVNSGNPLTARVAVNRVWQKLFGRGIVTSLNNFGNNGESPSHPRLLDFLAADFRDEGWSIKRMIKQITMSRVYQLSCASSADLSSVDPENRLLSRQNHRRMDAESIRDAMLVASGQVDLKPPVGSVVQKVGNGNIGRGISANRFDQVNLKRSVYLPIVRSAVPESLRVFDFPEPSIIAEGRDVTTVPTQALYMLNSPFVLGQAKALAERVLADENTAMQQRIELAFRLALSRRPSQAELKSSENYLSESEANRQTWTEFCHVLIASAEFRYIQ